MPDQGGHVNPDELEAFLDDVMSVHLEAYHIPGATIAVVKDGELFFAKGYGYANLESGTPVVADKTLFRIGSVSKLFTWTAVMQLVEQGRLDLDANVNIYLQDFQIPDTYPQPITLAHLLTHTSGFEDQVNTVFARSADDLLPLSRFVSDNIPVRVRPPGEFAAYSNYGATLAGYTVEQVSDMPFDQYIEENITKPLDMYCCSFRQPVPPELASNLAMGYTYAGGVYQAGEFEYLQQAPAGSMSATATDMAKFMIAHLQDGHYGDTHILRETTAQEMHRLHFTHDPRLNGMAYGFIEMDRNNLQIIGHGGSTKLFHTLLALLPEQQVGLFVSYNSIGGAQARKELLQAFLDHYYPRSDAPTLQPLSDFRERARRFSGSYRETQSSYTMPEKVSRLFGGMTVIVNPDGTLQIGQSRYIEVKPLVFYQIDGQEILIFQEDDHGHVTHMFMNSKPTVAFIKLARHETKAFHIGLLAVFGVIFLTALVGWPIRALVNRCKGASSATRYPSAPGSEGCLPLGGSGGPPLACWLTAGSSALNLFSVIGQLVILMLPLSESVLDVPSLLRPALAISLMAAALTLGAVVFTVLGWEDNRWKVWGRLHHTLVTLTLLAFIWWMNCWNLLGLLF